MFKHLFSEQSEIDRWKTYKYIPAIAWESIRSYYTVGNDKYDELFYMHMRTNKRSAP